MNLRDIHEQEQREAAMYHAVEEHIRRTMRGSERLKKKILEMRADVERIRAEVAKMKTKPNDQTSNNDP